MAAKAINKSWNLQSFLDSLVYELDQARETLAIKGVNRPLSYAVKDLSLDLQLFPEYDGNKVKFKTAKPGDTGASRVAITLGSITDKQIRETTKNPSSEDDVSIDEIQEIDQETKQSLKKAGIESITDIEELERKNIDINKVKGIKPDNYGKLADRLKSLRTQKVRQRQLSIQKEERQKYPPKVFKINLDKIDDMARISLLGDKLLLSKKNKPTAKLNGQFIQLIEATANKITLEAKGSLFIPGKNSLEVKLDDRTSLKLNIE